MHDQTATVRLNGWVLSLTVAAGVALGLLPFLLYVGAPVLALPLFAYGAAVTAWKCRRFVSYATERPGWGEWLLAGWNAVGRSAAVSLIGFLWYWLAFGAATVFAVAARALSFAIEPNSSMIATYGSALVVGVFALALPVMLAEELASKLYPAIAGIRSAFFPLATQPWRLALPALAVVGSGVVGLALLDRQGLWFLLLLALALVIAGGLLTQPGAVTRQSSLLDEPLTAAKKLLAAAGYTLIEKPRTGSSEVDPLIAAVDLLARAPDRAYAIKAVVAPSQETEIAWSAAFEVHAGAQALQRVLRSADAPGIVVEPCLLVIGGRIGEDFRTFTQAERLKIVHFAKPEELGAALASAKTDAELRESAWRLLQVPPAGPSDAAAEARPSVPQ